MNIKFEAFDYKNLPDSGMYWIAGNRPVFDIDADDEGRTVGQPTNELENFTALVWLDVYDNDGGFHIDPVDAGNLGRYDETSTIEYIAQVKQAAHPHDVENKVFSIEGQVVFQRSQKEGASKCVCCPEGQNHVFNRHVRWDTRSPGLEFHYAKSADDLVCKLTGQFANEGRRIKLTAELVDDATPNAQAL